MLAIARLASGCVHKPIQEGRSPSRYDVMKSEIMRRRWKRERKARLEAESILEIKSFELWHANEKLREVIDELDATVEERTRELSMKNRELSLQKAKLADSNARTDLVLAATKTGIWEAGLQSDYFYCSNELIRILDMPRESIVCRLKNESLPAPEYRPRLRAAYRDSLIEGNHCGIDEAFEIVLDSGERRWVRMLSKTKFDSQGNAVSVVGAFVDIHEEYQRNETIRHLATHDPLTQVPNRSTFKKALSETISVSKQKGERFSLALLDLNDFKQINDIYGHQAGDHVLVEVTRGIQSVLRPGDVFARLGGDEFALILHDDGNPAAIQRICRDILNICNSIVGFEGESISASISVGVSQFNDGSLDEEKLMRQADLAMYKAKNDRKNSISDADSGVCYFTDDLEDEARERDTLKSDLLRAIDEQQFVLHYQPQYCVREGTVSGVEALIRWIKDDGQVVMPDEFIGFAENINVIDQITDWVIEEACRQSASWAAQGIHIKIDLNISAMEFEDGRLPKRFEHNLSKYGVEGKNIGLEITESCIVGNVAAVSDQLEAFRALGVEISIDDFGTGYSSLSYLHTLPYETIKIDRSFITRLGESREAILIVNTISTLASSMGKKVVAEGVENEQQLCFLKRVGCDLVQGFYYSPPVSAVRVPELVRAGEQRSLSPCLGSEFLCIALPALKSNGLPTVL